MALNSGIANVAVIIRIVKMLSVFQFHNAQHWNQQQSSVLYSPEFEVRRP
jgi:hypothetical protein